MENTKLANTNFVPVAIGLGIAAIMILYAFFPMDLIPDFIPVAGMADDSIVQVIGIIAEVANLILAYKLNQQDKVG